MEREFKPQLLSVHYGLQVGGEQKAKYKGAKRREGKRKEEREWGKEREFTEEMGQMQKCSAAHVHSIHAVALCTTSYLAPKARIDQNI
jgi:hypothetical protein